MVASRWRGGAIEAGRRGALSSRLRSLRVHILLWTILPIAIFLLGLSFTDVYGHQREMRVMVEERDAILVRAAAGRIAENLAYNAHLLQSAGAGQSFRQADPATQARMLAPLDDIFLEGTLVWRGPGELGGATGAALAWGQEPFVESLARAAVDRGEPAYLATPEGLAVAVALPGGEGALVGVLPLARSVIARGIDALLVTPQAQTWLLDERGRPIYQAGALPTAEPGQAHEHGDEDLVTTAAPVGDTGWQVVLSEPWHSLVPLVLRYAQATVFIAASAVLISLLAVYIGVRYVTGPLQQLRQRARRMAWGDFAAVDDPVGGVEEIADLQGTLRQMASQVRGYQATMRNYVAAVTQAQEEERIRLARELHDDTVQSLIALGQQLERVQKAVSQAPEKCDSQLEELRRMTRDLVQGVRRLIGDLRPAYLDDLGLVPALEMLVRTIPQAQNPLLTVEGPPRRLAPDLELAVYRIVQAALKNVEQHGRAQNVGLRLSFDAQAVRVVVEDDGIGFAAPDSPDELAQKGHFGLLGMRERAMLFGGWLALTSQPGQGTRVEAYLPSPAE